MNSQTFPAPSPLAGPVVGGSSSATTAQPLSDLEKSSARKARKEAEKQKKQAKKYEEQLKKIRGPKSQKIQIIDESFLEKYHTAQALPPGPALKTKKRSKKTPSDLVQINLSDCIRDRLNLGGAEGTGNGELKTLIKPVVPVVINQPLVMHKGKQREVPKEKKLSKLKKDILNNRKAKHESSDQQEEETTPAEETPNQPINGHSPPAAVEQRPPPATPAPKLGVSPFLKAIEKVCSNDGPVPGVVRLPPSVGSEEYQNGFPSLEASVRSGPDKVQHSRNFRTYCDHLITEELRDLSETLVTKLFQFQANAYGRNPIKAVGNKRYCVGFNEVLKILEARKLKLVLIAPDLESNDSVDQLVERVKALCRQLRVPYVFGIKRRKLGFHLMKKVPVSCLGILNYGGADDTVKRMLEIVDQERVNYRNYLAQSEAGGGLQ
ncbi:selenocysteine insertion sequence-binding protein 2 [Uranotaenia lowii]|uniref:selenocysteine insertion sequence-binding protein 2 n=1 Tax=Uranotaenia lowii TaxID=190385 RepID=UPI00247B08B3|nr:selenocysteine insertion sequence-binding protein 2 [Uranotaenia lowii]